MPTFEFDTEKKVDNFISYLKTDFARFCLSLLKNSQHLDRGELEFVPYLDFTNEWNDAKLFNHFGVDEEAQNYISEFLSDYHGIRK
jgi:site-specific DNA-methyltransferase (adenine-specific)